VRRFCVQRFIFGAHKTFYLLPFTLYLLAFSFHLLPFGFHLYLSPLSGRAPKLRKGSGYSLQVLARASLWAFRYYPSRNIPTFNIQHSNIQHCNIPTFPFNPQPFKTLRSNEKLFSSFHYICMTISYI